MARSPRDQTGGPASPVAQQPVPGDRVRTASPQLESARRLWWLVLIVVVLAAGAAGYASTYAQTTYTGRSSLIVNSPDRAPDQDAILVQGYVDYFNDRAYQSQLLDQAGIDGDVTLGARAAAASPIMLIEATSTDADLAERTVSQIAETFQSDINAESDRQREAAVAPLQERLDSLEDPEGDDASAASTLEGRIADLEGDQTNRLQPLQLDGGLSVTQPSVVNNAVLGALGGLVLGVIAALLLGGLGARRRARRRPS